MVLKNCGPKGYTGMAEVGSMPLPPKVLRKGISDMVRVSDARMSGTAYGTVVLHAAPEAAAGGPACLRANWRLGDARHRRPQALNGSVRRRSSMQESWLVATETTARSRLLEAIYRSCAGC